MKRLAAFLILVLVLTSALFSSDDAVKLKYRKNPTPGVLSIVYRTTELSGDGDDVVDDDYDLETDETTNFPFVITWKGNIQDPDSYTVTFSTEGWKHQETGEVAIAVDLNVSVLADQDPNMEGDQRYASSLGDTISVMIPSLTNTDFGESLVLSSFRPVWQSRKNLTAGRYICTIGIDVTSGE